MRFGLIAVAGPVPVLFEQTGIIQAGVVSGVGQPCEVYGGPGLIGAGGAVALFGGAPALNQLPGGVSLVAANAVISGQGGAVTISAGLSFGPNTGGSVTLTATPGSGVNQNGGNVALNTGAATGSGIQGAVVITPSSGNAVVRAASLDLYVGGAPAAAAPNGIIEIKRTPTSITTTGQTLINGAFYRIDTNAGSLAAVNLQNPNVSAGQSVYFTKTSVDSNTITLKSPAGNINNVSGATGILLGGAPEIIGWAATCDGANWWVLQLDRATAGVGASCVLEWGNNSVSGTTTTRYFSPGFDQTLAQTSALAYRVPRAGVLRNMYILHNTGAGNGNAIVYTLRKNSVATALTVSIASTGTTAQDTTHSVSVVAGDRIDIEITKAASIGSSPTDITCALEFAA